MLEKISERHDRMLRATAERRVHFKLYKRGRNWVVAGLMTAVFGLGIATSPRTVRADESGEPQVAAVQVAATPSEAPDEPGQDLPPADVTAPAPSPEGAEASAATVPDTGTPASASLEVASPQTASTPLATTSAAPAPAPTAVMGDSASEVAVPSAPITDETPISAIAPLAAAPQLLAAAVTPPAGVVMTAPQLLNNSAAVRDQGRLAALTLTTTIEGASNYATSTSNAYRVITRWIGNSSNLTPDQISLSNADYRAHPIVPGYRLVVTNARNVGGVWQLTQASTITVTISAGTVVNNTALHNFSFNVVGYPSLNVAPIGAGFTADTTKTPLLNSLEGDMSVFTARTLTLSRDVSVTATAANIGAQGVMVYFKTPLAPWKATQDFQPSVILAYFDAPVSYQLAPKVTSPLSNSATLSGTGTEVGNLITVRAISGGPTVQTTVGTAGTWSVNLDSIGLTTNQDLYVVESNNLGDVPGGYIIQHATASRTINYVDAAGNTVSPSVTQTLAYTRRGTVDPATMVADYGAWTADGSSTFASVNSPNLSDQFTTTKTVGALTVTNPTQRLDPVNVVYNPRFATVGPDEPNTTGVALEALSRTVTQTINYENEDGTQAAPAAVTTLRFTRTATVNLETNRVVGYTAWLPATDDTFAAVVSPTLVNQVASRYASQVQTVTAADLNNPTLAYAETIVYFPDMVRLDPGVGVSAGTPVSGADEDPRRYPSGVDTTDLTRVIREMIRYIDASTGAAVYANDEFDVTYTRTGIVTFAYDAAGTLVTTPILEDWISPQPTFQEVIAPAKDGYVSAGNVAAVPTDAATPDLTRTIWYYPEAELTHTVTVVTTFDAPVVVDAQRQTLTFSRELLLTVDDATGDTTVRLSDWRPDVAGTELIAALGPTMPMPDNGDPGWAAGWRAAVSVAVNSLPVGDGTDRAIQLNRRVAPAGVIAVELNGTATEITRLVTYTDTLIHIQYVDLSDGGRVMATVHTTTPQTDPSHYGDTVITTGPAAGSYHLEVDAGAASLAQENGTIVDGNEHFTAQPGQTVTIELRHRRLVEPLTVLRGIRYVVLDGAVEPADPFVIQEAAWEQVTDLYAQAYGDQLTTPVDAVVYRQLTGYPVVPTPVIPEYRASQAEIVAVAPAPSPTPLRPMDNLTFEVTYTRNVFTPENPGNETVTTAVAWTIVHKDAVTGQTLSLPGYVPATLGFHRNVTVLADDVKMPSPWAPDTTWDFATYQVPSIAGYVAGVTTLAGPTVTDPTRDILGEVRYYPAVVIVQPDAPKQPGEESVTGDPQSPKFPAGVTHDDLNRTITRTLAYWDVAGNQLIREVPIGAVTFMRTATVTFDQDGTSSTVYGAWQPADDTFAEYALDPADREIGDLFTTATHVVAQPVTADSEPVVQRVNYYPTSVTLQPDDSKAVDTQYDPNDALSPTYPAGLTATDLNQTVTQTIHFVDQVKATTLQPEVTAGTLRFTRTATVNLQTKAVTYGDWQPVTDAEFPAFTAIPAILNELTAATQVIEPVSPVTNGVLGNVDRTVYYVRKPVAELTVTPDQPKNAGDEVFTEYPGIQTYPNGVTATDLHRTLTRTITYLSGMDWATLAPTVTQTLDYERSARVQYTLDADGNIDPTVEPIVEYGDWVAVGASDFAALTSPTVPDQFTTRPTVEAKTPTAAEISAGVELAEKVYYYLNQITVGLDRPMRPGISINSSDELLKSVPSGLEEEDFQTTVTEWISFFARHDASIPLYSDANGTTPQVAQTVALDFTRTATLYLETMTYVYNAWQGVTADEFAAVDLPATLYDADGDEYAPLDAAIAPVTLDLTQAQLPERISRAALYGMPPYQSLEIGPKDPVNGDDPTGPKPADTLTTPKDPTSNQRYPAGIEASNLNHTVTLTVHYVVSDGQTPVPAPMTLTLAFERGATVTWPGETPDEWAAATGVVTYHPWRAVTTEQFAAVLTPALAAYFADQLSVTGIDALALVSAAENATTPAVAHDVTVTYYPTTVSVTPEKPGTEGAPVITDQIDGPKYPAGVTAEDLTQTITRTITRYNGVTGAVIEVITQTLDFTRTATLTYASVADLPTPQYSDWTAAAGTTGEFDRYVPAAEPDLFADKAEVAAHQPTQAEIDTDGVVPEAVWYYPTTIVVEPDQPGTAGDALFPTENSPKYPAGVAADDLTKTLTRTIIYRDAQTGAVLETILQPLTFTRTATLGYGTVADTPTPNYSEWGAAEPEFAQVTVAAINGKVAERSSVAAYAPTQAEIDAGSVPPEIVLFFPTTLTVTPDKPGPEGESIFDGSETPKYPAGTDANDLTKTVTREIYDVDAVTKAETLVNTETLTFTRNATLAIDGDGNVTLVGYTDWTAAEGIFASFAVAAQPDRVASRDTVAERTPTTDEIEGATPIVERVYFYPTSVTVDPDKPGVAGEDIYPGIPGPVYPDKVSATDLNRTVTRTITFINAATGDTYATETQTLTFKRSATLTLTATEATVATYGPWTADDDTFDAMPVPARNGLFADRDTVAAAVPTDDEITAGEAAPVVVAYYATVVTVTPEAPHKEGDLVVTDEVDGPKYPAGVDTDDLTRTLTRTITYVHAQTGATLGTATQALHFTRTATLHYASAADQPEPVYSDWTPAEGEAGEFELQVVPSFAGVVTFESAVPTHAVTQAEIDANQPLAETVYYFPTTFTVTPDKPGAEGEELFPGTDGPTYPDGVTVADLTKTVTRTIIYYNAVTGTEIRRQTQALTFTREATLTLTPARAVAAPEYSAWVAAPDQFAAHSVEAQPNLVADRTVVEAATPTAAEIAAGRVADETVTFYGDTVTVTPDKPGTAGELVDPDETGGLKYPDGVDEVALNRTVTRTITYVNAMTGATLGRAEPQTLRFTRTAPIKYVTGGAPVVTYGAWQPVAEADRTFAALPAPAFDDLRPVTVATAARLVTDAALATATGFDEQLKYYATMITVTPDQPGEGGTAIVPGDPDSPLYPAGVGAADLKRSATRTIHYRDAAGNPLAPSVTAVLGFHRTATLVYDLLGAVTVLYGPWLPDAGNVFATVASPTVVGMVADRGLVDAATVTGPESVTEVVTYAAALEPRPAPPPSPTPTPQPSTTTPPKRADLPQTGEPSSVTTTAWGLALLSLVGLLGVVAKKRRRND
ncbi:mucin-binding protein [Lacticaseibacillus daqingensis]|uniref:mucin-binding protein n=1 Tax=Lacticaseibacillus daqingensis TaxID=2486014 RepID=UPI000F7816F4|nr:KxYKxGKxW signal peptide domain-containing protein [Lacticaseibacillus daqingensis]